MTALPPDFDQQYFRSALGRFATGVTVITTETAEGRPWGLTVSSFNAVSLQPPMVLWPSGSRGANRKNAFSICP